MSERVYRTIDKTGWGEGPWNDEPDKVQWTDEATGLPCLAKRNRYGVWCGYVGVPPGHRFYRVEHGSVDAVVHGGLTYSDSCEDGPEATSICHVPEPGEPDDVWWLGFDCGHGWDFMPAPEFRAFLEGLPPLYEGTTYRDLGYVRAQCYALALQLAEEVRP